MTRDSRLLLEALRGFLADAFELTTVGLAPHRLPLLDRDTISRAEQVQTEVRRLLEGVRRDLDEDDRARAGAVVPLRTDHHS
jgi:hypothetical protein